LLELNLNKILALGAHPDDIELGCTGTLLHCLNKGLEVHMVTLSDCCNDGEIRTNEFFTATNKLGATDSKIYNITDTEFPENRREIMKILSDLQDKIKPNIVFIPYIKDPHQDHKTLAECATRIFRRNETIFQYEILRHGSYSFTPTLFVEITDFIEDKIQILNIYKSQIAKRAYLEEESFRSLARTRGAQSGFLYAEGFMIYKMFWNLDKN